MTTDILAQLNEADRENAALRARVREMGPLTICKCGDQFDADSPGICPSCQRAETVALKAKLEDAETTIAYFDAFCRTGHPLIQWHMPEDAIECPLCAAQAELEEAERTARIQANHAGEVEKDNLRLEAQAAALAEALEDAKTILGVIELNTTDGFKPHRFAVTGRKRAEAALTTYREGR